jgi:hypothetical protein
MFILKVLFFLDGAMSLENSILYWKDMTKRDELVLFTVCILSALDKSFNFSLKLLMDFLHTKCSGETF